MNFDFFPASLSEWLMLGARLVGATFVWAGTIKSIAPHTFRSHIASLGFVPARLHSQAVTLTAAGEVGWGLVLMTGTAAGLTLPLTVGLLVVLTSISWWGVSSGKAKDCGCYGGFIQPSIGQSAALNAIFAGLAGAAWLAGNRGLVVSAWQAIIVIVGAGAAAFLAHVAQKHETAHGEPMFDTSPLKVGRTWKHSWADGATRDLRGEVLVAYLGPNCPFCSQFVKVANAMVQSPALPRVVGVMSAPNSQVAAYKDDYQIRFPVVTVSDSLMGRLVRAVPTAVIVDSGKIREMWVGHMPPHVVDRFRDAFFPDLAKVAKQNAG
jgi:hypothetical protein